MIKVGGILAVVLLLVMLPVALAQQAYLPPASQAHGTGCMITWQENVRDYALPDFDCDGVTDNADNCIDIPNANQRDTNRNGQGDVCDTIIEEIILHPDNQLLQGEFAHITVRLVNNQPQELRDILVTVKNTALEIDASQHIESIPPGHNTVRDFWVKVPNCARAQRYPISITATSNGQTQQSTENIEVQESDACVATPGTLDNTVVEMFGQIDIEAGETALIPITLFNLGERRMNYDISVSDPTGSSSWRIDPGPGLSLAAGGQARAYLYLQTEKYRPAGQQTVLITVASNDQKTVIPLLVQTRVYRQQGGIGITLLQLFLMFLIIVLILAAIIIAAKKKTRKNSQVPKKRTAVETTNLETYY